jgi:hypothetical protein
MDEQERHDQRSDSRSRLGGDDRSRDASNSTNNEDRDDITRWRTTRDEASSNARDVSRVLTKREREERWPIG